MSSDQIALLLSAVAAFVFWLYLGIKEEVFKDLWSLFSDAFNWLRRGSSREKQTMEQRIGELEHWSDQWTDLRLAGRIPMWVEPFGWIDDCSLCPCGYVAECAIWCGPGHENGRCAGENHGHRPPTFAEQPVIMTRSPETVRVIHGIGVHRER